MINAASLNCGEQQLLEACGTRLRIAELLYMGHVTFGQEHADNLISLNLIAIAIARCQDGKARELTPKEEKYFYRK